MGSSKKHKEKRDKKKHKKNRSRSRERDHKKSHKSSSRKEKRKSLTPDLEVTVDEKRRRIVEDLVPYRDPEPSSSHEEKSPVRYREPSPDDDFDIDKLLDSKLSEKNEAIIKRPSKKRIREDAIEEFKRRQNIKSKEDFRDDAIEESKRRQNVKSKDDFQEDAIEEFKRRSNIKNKEDSLERFTPEPILEDYRLPEAKHSASPLPESPHIEETSEIPFITDGTEEVRGIKQEPQDDYVEEPVAERTEPQLSLSISETNKLRAKLGLKPLDVGSDIPGLSDENSEKDPSKKVEVFVKTENISDIKKSEALREKLKVTKEKRAIEEKLRKTKGVAESDSEEESAADWVVKHQKLMQEKERAERRAKMLEEMDEEFGVGALVEEEFQKSKAYTSRHLKGLKIGHDIQAFKEGTPVILTLKDKGVLEEEEDVLENVNIVDTERYAKNVENKKKKPDYKPYEEPEFDEFGILKKKNLLSKYDEEIEGEKKKSFKIGSEITSSFNSREQELELIRMRLKQQNKISLDMPEMKVANEYYTPADMVQFKKPKKKKRIRKTTALKADDLLADNMETTSDLGSRKRKVASDVPYTSDIHEMEVPEMTDISDIVIDEEQAEELKTALNKAKKLKQRRIMSTAPEKVIEILNKTTSNGSESSKETKGVHIELNSVAEFCRTLGDIPTYGMSGNRDEEEEMMDLEREILEEKQKQELDAQNRGAWNEVDIDEKPAEISVRENEPILEEEPDINNGIAGALKLATKKGYLDKESKKAAGAPRTSQLQAQSYTIEEKFYEDDKFGKRDRYTGPVQEFREKSHYKPDVKLEYIDDSGRLLTAKEAFRYLSHKFHGKGPGKNKVDKRMKKLEQDTRLKQMSSTDTPLNTVKLLQAKQKETQSPYIVLSGGNKTLTQTMISKTKH